MELVNEYYIIFLLGLEVAVGDPSQNIYLAKIDRNKYCLGELLTKLGGQTFVLEDVGGWKSDGHERSQN